MPLETPSLVSPAEANADVAVKLAAQDISGQSNAQGSEDEAANAALDALATSVVEKKETPEVDVVVPEVKPATSDTTPNETPAKPDAAPEVKPDTSKSDELFKGTPTLPPGASPKSSEAFAAVKQHAAQEISTRDAKIAALEAAQAELNEKLKNPGPAELTKELEEHRQWRARLDVDADPQFRAFDQTVKDSQEFIYAQLTKAGVTAEDIATIKKYGGPEMVKMEKIYELIKDPTTQRVIDSRISEIEQTKWKKEQAIATTKANIADYITNRAKAADENVGAHNKATANEFASIADKSLPWLTEKVVDAKADEATRKATEAHNLFAKDVKSQLDAAYSDDSPRMRAILLTGMAQFLRLQHVHEGTKASLATAEASLKEVTEKLTKFKEASTSRLRTSGATNGGKVPDVTKASDQFNKNPEEALDAIAAKIKEARAAAGK